MGDSTGSVLVSNGSGTGVFYDDDFKSAKDKGPIVNGLKEGEWKGIVNDTTTYVCKYSKGVSISGTSTAKSGKEYHFTQDHINPEFKGGKQQFAKFLGRTVHYPPAARENNVQGKVFVSFVVNEDGKLSDFKIARGAGIDLNNETIRVLKLCPPWKPGVEFEIVSKIPYTIPVTFTLEIDN